MRQTAVFTVVSSSSYSNAVTQLATQTM